MITDAQVIELYIAAGWTFRHEGDMSAEEFVVYAPDGFRVVLRGHTVFNATEFIAAMMAKNGDPRQSLDAGFMLLDAIVPYPRDVRFYTDVYDNEVLVIARLFDNEYLDSTRPLALTAVLLAYVREREAQS